MAADVADAVLALSGIKLDARGFLKGWPSGARSAAVCGLMPLVACVVACRGKEASE